VKKILYIVSTLKRSGPTNQLFNIIANLDRDIFHPILVTLSPEPIDSRWQDYETLGIEMHSLNLSRLGGLVYAKSKLKSLINELHPDLNHTQGIRADSLLASIQPNIPWMLTARNFPFEDYPMKFGRFSGGLMARKHAAVQKKCANVIACSKSIQKQLSSIGVSSFAIQNGVSAFVESSRKALDERFEAPVFLTVGSLIPRKNTRLIIEAFELWKTVTQSRGSLVILGDGVERKELEALASDSIHFMGNVANVSDYLGSADYFVSASLSEGLPNTVLEALASGLPVILSDIPSHLEIFDECKSACRILKLSVGVIGLVDEFKGVGSNFDSSSNDDAKRVANDVFSALVMSKHYQDYYLKILERI
jgi:glycosyltransferase involved in cell wall biosynthesis